MAERILIVGSGAREDALAWSLAKPGREVYIAPGNGGTRTRGINVPYGEDDIPRIVQFASNNQIGLTVVGPERPLVAGIVNAFSHPHQKLPIFGPTEKAIRIEGSKSFAVELMREFGIPHPETLVFDDPDKAREFIENPPWERYVLKADGLADGKGVSLPEDPGQARQEIFRIMEQKVFGETGNRLLIQERLVGREVSFMAFTDGTRIVPMIPTQDYKRLGDNDTGPNTGGMGAIASEELLTPQQKSEALDLVLRPIVDGMRQMDITFKGVLYAGLMLTTDGIKVLEFNGRLGDPEAQAALFNLSSDLLPILRSCMDETLSPDQVTFNSGVSLAVVLASEGYPQDTSTMTGREILGLRESYQDAAVFHGRTRFVNRRLLADRGRVLTVVARGEDVSQAREKVYDLIGNNGVHFRGMQYRRDIGIINFHPKGGI